MKKRKSRIEKKSPFTAFTDEVTAAYRNHRYELAESIYEKHRLKMTVNERGEAEQMVRWVRDFDPDPMYGRMSGPETPGLFLVYRELKKTGSGSVDILMDYLEADRRFFGSGYIKEAILQLLKKSSIEIRPHDARRLRRLILAVVRETPKRHTRYYWRLAPRVSDSGFIEEINQLTRHPLSYVRDNATALKLVLQSAKEIEG